MRSYVEFYPALLAAAVSCLAIASPAAAQTTELASLEAFIDSVAGVEIREYGVPGMVIAVVRDGRVVHCKGYGYADIRARRPMSPDSTVMRVGSVAKPVTALAALQLAEAGRIDLDARVDAALPGLLRGRHADRVRVRDLFTHTSGLDVRLNGTTTTDPRRVLSLEDYLRRDLPPVVHPPGEVIRYSNHGYVVLGRLVETASAESFDSYVQRHLFAPLGMRSSSFRLEGALARRAATGYEAGRRGPVPAAVLHPHIAPAAGLNTTAADMARLMVALLDSGRAAGTAPLYSTRMAALALGRHWGMHPGMPGMTYGMFETRRGGVRGVGHSGGIRGFMSGMYLWPAQRTGIFISNNGNDGGAVQAVYDAFVDRYLADPRATPPPPPPGADARAARAAGTYRLASLAVRNLERAGALRRGELRIRPCPGGCILLFGQRYVEISPGVYQAGEGGEVVGFSEGRRGERWMLTSDPFGGNRAWERIAWYQPAAFGQTLAIMCLIGFLSLPWMRPAVPPGVLKRQPSAPAIEVARRHRQAVAAGYLLFPVTLAVAFRAARATGLLAGVPLGVRAALTVGLVVTVLAAALPVTGWRLRRACAPRAERVVHTAVTIVALVFALLMWSWNLLGFRFG
ncbi:MAG TPA: serine hydrolase domain-containing protein [Longimicrobium sp.]|nr:serine hydrolase domain-containing protein [Longimicrobium sp.]